MVAPKPMIGLDRHTVLVVDHDARWTAIAADACDEIRRVCGDLVADVQHVGSTSVPALPAKPILDIAVAAATSSAILDVIQRLIRNGYIYREDGGDTGGHFLVRESLPGVRTIHVHLIEHGTKHWRNYLMFRDVLRGDESIRRRYAELKQELGRRFQHDRKAYTESKDQFIREILDATEALRSVESTGLE